MEDGTPSDGDAEPSSRAPSDSGPTLERMTELLSAKDDTSRFVGLALLKSLLDNQPQLRQDVVQVGSIWDAISPKFLDRLLKSGQNRDVTKQESNSMVDIAVAVIHIFAILLPAEASNYTKLVGRTATLVDALVYSSPESTVLILQTLVTITSQLQGAQQVINIEDLSPLTEIAIQYPMVLDVLSMAWSTASTDISQAPKVKHSLNKVIPMLLNTFKGTDGVTLIASIGHSLTVLPPGAIPKDPAWLLDLVKIMRKLVASRPTQAARSAYTKLAASLLQSYPIKCHSMLFADRHPSMDNDSKPFCYLFISLILIDIRSTIPSLLSKLNSPEYPATSSRLASAFDVVSHFVGFLMQSLRDDESPTLFSVIMPPDLLLKFRKNVAETLSLTMEYLRDRWDASVAGAAGLHPSARTGTTATSEGTRLTLTWDSTTIKVHQDDMVLASFRTLALWLSEDDNASLRNEMGGLMDMLLELYQNVTISDRLDFQSTTLKILEAIIPTDYDSLERFLDYQGWEVLSGDLISIVRKDEMNLDEMVRVTSIVRVLLQVLDDESTTQPREDWMQLVKTAASMTPPTLDRDSATLDDESILVDSQVAVLQIALALLDLAGKGMRQRYSKSTIAITGMAKNLRTKIKRLKDDEWQECLDSIDDLILGLANLG